MKINKLLLMCSCAMISIMSTSCKSETIDNQNEDDKTPEVSTVLTYTINNLHDLPLFFDITALYTDVSGETSEVDIESTPYTISVDDFNRDQDVTLHLSFSLKDEYDTSSTSYTFGATVTISYLDSTGYLKSSTYDDTITCAVGKLDDAFEYYTTDGITFNFDVDIP